MVKSIQEQFSWGTYKPKLEINGRIEMLTALELKLTNERLNSS